MVLPRNGFVQPVEVVAGGPLPRNGFVQPVEVIGGAPAAATPVAGGSGQFYASITAALAGEVQTVVSGLVPQAGTGPGVIVGPGALSPVDDFYKDMFILNTSPAPSNGLVAQWARVSSYVGATRTFTIDKPWDFSAEASFEVIDPVRIMVFLDITEDVTVNKNLVIDLMGNRLKGKVDISSADFCWVRGSGGYITNGIQKTDFGILRADHCTVSRRDATIYAILLTNGSNLGRCEFNYCEFFGRVSGRRGFCGWNIFYCRNIGVPSNSNYLDLPYTLFESIAGVAIVVSAADIEVHGEFGGSVFYSENNMTGGAAYVSIMGDISAPTNFFDSNPTPRNLSVFRANAAGVLTMTLASGAVAFAWQGFHFFSAAAITAQSPVCSLVSVSNFTGTLNVTVNVISGTGFEIQGSGSTVVRVITVEGTVAMTGTLTFQGAGGIIFDSYGDCTSTPVCLDGPISTGSVVCSIPINIHGGFGHHIQFIANQTIGAPSVTVSSNVLVDVGFFPGIFDYGSPSISVGTYIVSGLMNLYGVCLNNGTLLTIPATVSGGTWTVSSSLLQGDVQAGGASIFSLISHLGSGGTVTMSSATIALDGDRFSARIVLLSAAGSGGSAVISGTIILNGFTSGTTTQSCLIQNTSAAQTSNITGSVTLINCKAESTFFFLMSTQVGSNMTGPTSISLENFVTISTLQTESRVGTETWAAATLSFRNCWFGDVFTLIGNRFSTVESFQCHFNGTTGNKCISNVGIRPSSVYRFWKCSFAARYDDTLPEVVNEYDVLPAQAALVQGQPVKVNGANQYQVCVAASVVDGVLLAAAGATGTLCIVVRQGRVFVAVNAGVANGDNLVLDTVTPTQVNTAAAVAVGQGVGTALEAAGTTIAGKAYTAVNVR